MTQIARRVGWKSRRRLHVIGSKAPEFDGDVQDDLVFTDDYWDCPCCVNEDWAVAVMPPMVFGVDGLVHISRPKDPTSVCGEAGNWPIPSMHSTDEALEYARTHRGDFRAVTCVFCIAGAPHWKIAWRAP